MNGQIFAFLKGQLRLQREKEGVNNLKSPKRDGKLFFSGEGVTT
jgi:hypothetical protein